MLHEANASCNKNSILAQMINEATFKELNGMKKRLSEAWLFDLYLFENKARITFCGQRIYNVPKKIKSIEDLTAWVLSKSDWNKHGF